MAGSLVLAASVAGVAVHFAQGVVESGVRSLLDSAKPVDTTLLVTESRAATIADATDVIDSLGIPVDTSRVATTRQAAITNLARRPVVRLMAGDQIQDLLSLVDGAWPKSTSGGLVEVVSPVALVDDLGLRIGDLLSLELDETIVEAVIVGVVAPIDPDDLRWAGAGATVAGLTGRRAPLIAAHLPTELLPGSEALSVVFPDLTGVGVDELPVLLSRVQRLVAGETPPGVSVATGLGQVLRDATRPVGHTESLVLMPTVLSLLACAVTLSILAKLVADTRREELWLLRARGFTNQRLLGLTVGEAVTVALPAALVSPALVWLGFRLAEVGVGRSDYASESTGATGHNFAAPGISIWLVAIFVAVMGAAVLVVFSLQSPGPQNDSNAAAVGHRSEWTRTVRVVGEVVAVALAVVAVRQFVRAEGVPANLLVMATPALVILSGGLLSVRVIHWFALLADRGVVRQSSGATASLATWNLGRQGSPRAMTLLVLASAVSTFSMTYVASWSDSQHDQAALAVGADLVVRAPVGQSPPSTAQLAAIEGVDAVMPVATVRVSGGLGRQSVQLIALDAEAAHSFGSVVNTEAVHRLVSERPIPRRYHLKPADDEARQQQVPAVATLPVIAVGSVPSEGRISSQSFSFVTTGQMTAFPGQGLPPSVTSGFIADLPTLAWLVFTGTGNIIQPNQWWLTSDNPYIVATEIEAQGLGVIHGNRAVMVDQLLSDPFGRGIANAVGAAAISAVAFAVIGVVLASMATARDRRHQQKVLIELGMSFSQQVRSGALEQAIILLMGGILGTGLGVAVSHLLIPRVLLTSRGTAPIPEVRISVPWLVISGSLLTIGVAMIASGYTRRIRNLSTGVEPSR